MTEIEQAGLRALHRLGLATTPLERSAAIGDCERAALVLTGHERVSAGLRELERVTR